MPLRHLLAHHLAQTVDVGGPKGRQGVKAVAKRPPLWGFGPGCWGGQWGRSEPAACGWG